MVTGVLEKHPISSLNNMDCEPDPKALMEQLDDFLYVASSALSGT